VRRITHVIFPWARQLGVTHVCVDPPGNAHHWRLDDLRRHKEHVESFGLALDMARSLAAYRHVGY
jgi:D-mannonate dehydratase